MLKVGHEINTKQFHLSTTSRIFKVFFMMLSNCADRTSNESASHAVSDHGPQPSTSASTATSQSASGAGSKISPPVVRAQIDRSLDL